MHGTVGPGSSAGRAAGRADAPVGVGWSWRRCLVVAAVLELCVTAVLVAWVLRSSGHLVVEGGFGVSGPAATGRPVAVGGPWLCTTGTATVRLVRVGPAQRVGEIGVRTAVHRIDRGAPTDLVGVSDGPLPVSYAPANGAEVPACASPLRLVIGVELRRTTRAAAAVSGLRVDYVERGHHFSTDAHTDIVLCGSSDYTLWPPGLHPRDC